MGRPERQLDPAAGPVQRFAFELRKLRQGSGGTSYRLLARRAHYSATALSEAAAGEKLPSLSVTLAYVQACGGDRAEWEARWKAVAAELTNMGDSGELDRDRLRKLRTQGWPRSSRRTRTDSSAERS